MPTTIFIHIGLCLYRVVFLAKQPSPRGRDATILSTPLARDGDGWRGEARVAEVTATGARERK